MADKKNDTCNNTKNELIDAALELFAMNGYEGVSTRAIVKKANVNISAIAYYFGGKEGLYKAIIESKVNLFEVQMEAIVNEVKSKKIRSAEEQKQLLMQIFDKYIDFVFSKGISQYLILLLIREMNNPTAAFDLFYDKVIGKMHMTLASVIAAIFNRKEDDEEMIILTTTLIGQVLMFRFAKTLVIRRLNKDGYSQETLVMIKNTVLNNVKLIIDNWN